MAVQNCPWVRIRHLERKGVPDLRCARTEAERRGVLKAGDPIWYRQICRGGYGFDRDVPGEFMHTTPRRVTVRLWMKDGTRVEVVVHPNNVRPRDPGIGVQ